MQLDLDDNFWFIFLFFSTETYTVKMLSLGTVRSEQTVQIQGAV